MISLNINGKIIQTYRPAFVMGIVNATPDSFFAESRGNEQRAFKLIEDGVDIIDIGGESTRPGFTEVPVDEEIARVIPVIRKIRKESSVIISVDTRKAQVMKAALDEGADIINDVSAFEDDEKMVDVAAGCNATVILMHRGKEGYKAVSDYLDSRADFAISHGISAQRIIVDPGIGFDKDLEENLDLIKNCGKLCDGKYPVLMALSNKRCIGEMTGKDAEHRLSGTVTADIISVMNGAKLIRVHDVSAAIDSLNVMKYLK